VTAVDLAKEFKDNADAATQKYSGKTLILTGEIMQKPAVSEESRTIYLVGLPAQDILRPTWGQIRCEMTERDGLDELRLGQTVEVQGNLAVFVLGSAVVEGCKVIKSGPIPPNALPDKVVDTLTKEELERRKAEDKAVVEKLVSLGVDASHGFAGAEITLKKENLTLEGAIQPEIVEQLNKLLQFAQLRANEIPLSDAGLQQIGKFATLKRFNAYRCRFTDAGLGQLANLAELEFLESKANSQVTGKGLAKLAGLRRLEGLWILPDEFANEEEKRRCNITDEGMPAVGTMRALRELMLTETQITDAGLGHLKGLPHLRSVTLDGAPIAGPGTAHLAECPNLVTLSLVATRVDDAGAANLARVQTLVRLDLRGNAVGNEGLAELAKLSNLESLNLAGTKVSDAGLAPLQKLSKLQFLWLPTEPQVTAAAVEKLKAALPKLESVSQQ